jgi:predicted phage terminase large subunit-like protein
MLTAPALDHALESLTPQQTAQLTRVLAGVNPSFTGWKREVSPTFRWDWPHLMHLDGELERVLSGECRRLLVTMPPRHGKSEDVTVRLPAYVLSYAPWFRFIVGAYNATLAQHFSRKIRRVADAAGVRLSEDRNAVEQWETTAEGGVRAAGVGGGVTGHGANGILIDDPIKSRKEAESVTYRNKLWDWFRDDIWTRQEPGAFVIVTLTRWHEDDLAGRILASEDAAEWEVLNLPALAEPNDPLGRPVGAALCPERYDETALLSLKRVLGEYSFSALFQGNPTPKASKLLARHCVEIVDALPAGAKSCRGWDKASTQGGGDYTAGVKIARAGETYYVVDAVREQLAPDARRRLMKSTAALDGPSCRIRVEQEPGASGKEGAEITVRDLAGYPVNVAPSTEDKVTRALSLSAQWLAGNVKVIRGPWNDAFLTECDAFPRGKHDDQVDAAAIAFNELALTTRVMVA